MPLSKSLKITLAIVGGLFLIIVLLVGAGIYWISKNGEQFVKGYAEAADKTANEGKKFGEGTDTDGCLKEAIARSKQDSSFKGILATNFFLMGCLETGKTSPNTCTDVPASNEMINTAKWTARRCAELGAPDGQGCQQILRVLQKHCDALKKAPPPPVATPQNN